MDTKNIKIIAQMTGGSRSYSLDTPASDFDTRFVFLNTELSRVLGLKKHEHQESSLNGEDYKGKELRRYFGLLQNSNTEAVEALFAEESNFSVMTPLFADIRKHRKELVDTQRMFNTLRGYLSNEKKLMLGLRTGTLGGKRKEALDKFGYSYKNFIQGQRLCAAGTYFFQTGIFPVDLKVHLPELQEKLMNIKLHPDIINQDEAEMLFDESEQNLITVFEERDKSKDLTFNENLAEGFILRAYFPMIYKEHINHWTEFRSVDTEVLWEY